jgi:hypothetical protein
VLLFGEGEAAGHVEAWGFWSGVELGRRRRRGRVVGGVKGGEGGGSPFRGGLLVARRVECGVFCDQSGRHDTDGEMVVYI